MSHILPHAIISDAIIKCRNSKRFATGSETTELKIQLIQSTAIDVFHEYFIKEMDFFSG